MATPAAAPSVLKTRSPMTGIAAGNERYLREFNAAGERGAERQRGER